MKFLKITYSFVSVGETPAGSFISLNYEQSNKNDYLGGPTIILDVDGFKIMTNPTLGHAGTKFPDNIHPLYWSLTGLQLRMLVILTLCCIRFASVAGDQVGMCFAFWFYRQRVCRKLAEFCVQVLRADKVNINEQK